MTSPCKHPPTRQYSGFSLDENLNEIMWVGCLDCGDIRTVQLPRHFHQWGRLQQTVKTPPAVKTESRHA